MQDPGRKPRIAAVVVTHNRRALLERCLAALIHQVRPLDEILVIDNASTDGTGEMLVRKYGNKVTHVRLDENLGGSAGFYEGFRLAYEKEHDWIWVMDDDVEALPDALKELTESPSFSDPSVGLLSSLVLDTDLKPQIGSYKRFNRLMDTVPAVSEESLTRSLVPIEAAGFLGVMVRREAISTVGLPLRDLFIYWDDTEFIYRISRRFKAFLVPSSKVIHRNVWAPPRRRRFSDLWKQDSGVPFAQSWRTYYVVRNTIFVRTRYVKPWIAPFILAKTLLKPVGVAVFFRDHKLARCKLLCQATIDGIWGRLGKRVSP